MNRIALLYRAILLTTPTVANVGVSLTVPLALVTDMISKYSHNAKDWFYVPSSTIIGALLVIIGFILVNTGLKPLDDLVARIRHRDGQSQSLVVNESAHNPIILNQEST